MLPFPYDGVAGAVNDPREPFARNLHENYKWIARLADEMDAEAELDLKRCMQIVMHCRKFCQWYESLQNDLDLVEGYFAMKKCRWPSKKQMADDLAVLYTECKVLADYIDANVPEYRQGFATVRVISDGVLTDDPIKRQKPAHVGARFKAFRSLFGGRPA